MNEINEKATEFILKDHLIEKRKRIKTFDDLIGFLRYIVENCNSGYGTAPRAIAQACLAVGYFLSQLFGITTFQAGAVMWDFIEGWLYTDNKCGLKIMDYDDMLYPQYEDKFQKTITPETWRSLQKQAAKELENNSVYTAPSVLEHWQSIVDGKVPFGYEVVD